MGNKLVRARQYPWGVVQGECGGESTAPAQGPSLVPCPALLPVNHCPASPLWPSVASCLWSVLLTLWPLSCALSSRAHLCACLTARVPSACSGE